MKQYLNVPYEEKDEAKELGARWDPNVKQWFIFVRESGINGEQRITFGKWLKGIPIAQPVIIEYQATKWCPAWDPEEAKEYREKNSVPKSSGKKSLNKKSISKEWSSKKPIG